MYRRIPLLLALLAFLLVQAHADFLSPSFVGETMSMPLDPELVLKAKEAGVITRENPLYDTVSGPSRNLGAPEAEELGSGVAEDVAYDTTYGAAEEAAFEEIEDSDTGMVDVAGDRDDPEMRVKNSPEITAAAKSIDVTGTWSLDLQDTTSKHLNLDLVQNKGAVMGSGTMEVDEETQKVTASGSLDGKRLSLAVMPVGSLDLYKLDLSLDPETTGSYTAYSSDGSSWSGDASGMAPEGMAATAEEGSEARDRGFDESYNAASDPSEASVDEVNEDASADPDNFGEFASDYEETGADEADSAREADVDTSPPSTRSTDSASYKPSTPAPVELGQGSASGGTFSSSKSISMVSGGGSGSMTSYSSSSSMG